MCRKHALPDVALVCDIGRRPGQVLLGVEVLNVLTTFCICRALLGMHAHLRSSALLAMTKLMAIEPAFCEANLPLLFTLLEKRQDFPASSCCASHFTFIDHCSGTWASMLALVQQLYH